MGKVTNHIEISEYDFVDFGCSKGGSLQFARRTFNVRHGLGIDLDTRKVELATADGGNAVVADATQPDIFRGTVRFCIMSHFLEHLPALSTAKECISTACKISREFVFIRQPWYDADGYLLSRQLKFYWSDWTGHTNPMTSFDMWRIARSLMEKRRIRGVAISGWGNVSPTSGDLIPFSAPENVKKVDLKKYSHDEIAIALNQGGFPMKIFRELRCLLLISA